MLPPPRRESLLPRHLSPVARARLRRSAARRFRHASLRGAQSPMLRVQRRKREFRVQNVIGADRVASDPTLHALPPRSIPLFNNPGSHIRHSASEEQPLRRSPIRVRGSTGFSRCPPTQRLLLSPFAPRVTYGPGRRERLDAGDQSGDGQGADVQGRALPGARTGAGRPWLHKRERTIGAGRGA